MEWGREAASDVVRGFLGHGGEPVSNFADEETSANPQPALQRIICAGLGSWRLSSCWVLAAALETVLLGSPSCRSETETWGAGRGKRLMTSDLIKNLLCARRYVFIITFSNPLYWVCYEPISQMRNLSLREAWDSPKVMVCR